MSAAATRAATITVEHDALRRRKVNLTGEAANLKVAQPDQRAYERRVASDLARAGIEEARLIRNLDMVEFSFGFTRVASSPETVQKDRRMPVRLRGFPPLPSNKRPNFSGLDLGSLSEVIFAADLAFVVHRRGMTEDLGNISSMWRDQNAAFLRYLVARRELRCGSGTLCDHRGGACPACIMIPETSCIAGNQLLSRATLVGGRAPLWDTNQTPLQGFFEIVQGIRNAGAVPAPG